MLTSSIPLGCQDHLSNLLIKRRTVKLVVKFFPSRISILHLSLYWFPKHFLAYNVLLYTLLGVLPGPLASLPSPPLVLSLNSTVADLDLQIKGGGRDGHPDREIRGGGRSQKKFFSVLRASVWSKNKGGQGPPGPLPWIRHYSKHSCVAVSERLSREQKKSGEGVRKGRVWVQAFFLYLSPTPLTLVLLSSQLWRFVRMGLFITQATHLTALVLDRLSKAVTKRREFLYCREIFLTFYFNTLNSLCKMAYSLQYLQTKNKTSSF